MRKDARLKSKSDYSLLRKRHKDTPEGVIYENDLMTISKMDEYFSDQIPFGSDSGFKFSYRGGLTSQKKHYRGTWETVTEDSLVGTTSSGSVKTSESIIKLNPDYTSVRDFAYYGSAYEMFKGAVNNIVNKFPGELYFSEMADSIDGKFYYIIENPYEIDVDSDSSNKTDDYNPLRFFSESIVEYNIIFKDSIYQFSQCNGIPWRVERYEPTCREVQDGVWVSAVYLYDDTVEILVRNENGVKKLYYTDPSLSGTRIRPNETQIEAFYASLSPFESALLNRKTNPLYTITLDTIVETDEKRYVDHRRYTWPSANEYNPLTSGVVFSMYIESLSEMCMYYDEHKTDNIWRRLTHESIKNLDWTFIREVDNNTEDLSDIDSTRISAMCRLYGRCYDDIKMYIDAIKTSTNVSYNKKANMPDYCLSDSLELHGFDAVSLNITNDNLIRTDRLYRGELQGYTSSEANIEFTRRLILNSKYIFSIKGTRRSLDTILSMFGFDDDEYEINEFVVVASGRSDYEHFSDEPVIIDVDYPLACDITYINNYRDTLYRAPFGSNKRYENLRGLALAEIVTDGISGETQSYVVPWFSKDKNYDGRLYFQQYGGWKKMVSKKINLSIAPNVDELRSTNLFGIYDETITSLKFAKTLEDMRSLRNSTLRDGDVCYVTDISNLMGAYNFNPNDDTEKDAFLRNEYSHYFILENKKLSTWVGYYTSNPLYDNYGWKNILEHEYNTTKENLTSNGKKVLYYESILDEMSGNNQHGGHGNYDLGESYVEALTKPFKYAAETDDFSWFDDENVEIFKDYGFTPVRYIDNRKCWYFTDTLGENNIYVNNEAYNDEDVVDEYMNYDFGLETTEGTFAEEFTEEFN